MADQNLHDSDYEEWLRRSREEEEKRRADDDEKRKKDPKAAAKHAAKCTRTAAYGER